MNELIRCFIEFRYLSKYFVGHKYITHSTFHPFDYRAEFLRATWDRKNIQIIKNVMRFSLQGSTEFFFGDLWYIYKDTPMIPLSANSTCSKMRTLQMDNIFCVKNNNVLQLFCCSKCQQETLLIKHNMKFFPPVLNGYLYSNLSSNSSSIKIQTSILIAFD